MTTQTTTPMANRKNGVSTKEKCQDCTVSTITYNFPIKSKYRTFIIGHLQQNNTLNGKRWYSNWLTSEMHDMECKCNVSYDQRRGSKLRDPKKMVYIVNLKKIYWWVFLSEVCRSNKISFFSLLIFLLKSKTVFVKGVSTML